MLRIVLCILFLFSAASFGQNPPSGSEPQAPAPAPAAADAQPVSPEVAAAEADIAKSDWKSAEARLDPWLAAHPADERALFDSGYVADAEHRLADAAGFYRRAIVADPRSFEAHAELGMLLARQGKTAEARAELTTATLLDAGEAGSDAKAQVWRALARIDCDRDPSIASADLLEALKLSSETPADTLLAARIASQAGDVDEAEAAYRRVLAEDPNSVPANAGLAHLLIARRQYAEAEPLLRAALAVAPDNPALTAQLATVLAAEDKAEALPLLEKLHAAHPGDAAITRMLADLLAEAGDASAADHLDVDLLAAHPDDAGLLVAHGENLIALLQYAAAFAAFDKATQLDPGNAEAWSGLAFAASKTGQPSVTLHALTMRSKYLPEGPSTYFLWATAYDTLHEKAQAVVYYHHFLDAAAGNFPDQELLVRRRLRALGQ
ncbi:MAG: tetratricopeptide repeat protein [Terracidiphilus sp.]